MDKRQAQQEEQYRFPYHHIPSFDKNGFKQARIHPWGYVYTSYIENVLQHIEQVPHNSILDIGCGDGKLLYEARKKFPTALLAGTDYSEHALALAYALNFKNNVYLSTSPDKTKTYDVVTAIEVLEHISPSDTGEFAKSFASALSHDGIGIITVPSDNVSINKKHYQHFNEHLIRETLEEHLEIVEIKFLNTQSWQNLIIQRLFGNRLFILNHTSVSTALYNYYKRNMLISTANKCERLMVIVKKRKVISSTPYKYQ
jgi:2-polyprenyl-3-methyl-5-hydroxy-6-metoxy-1,4-benzoquinol methylase